MTKEQQDKYAKLKEYLRFLRTDSVLSVACVFQHGRPEFTEKLRQLFKEEQDYLNKQIEEL